LPLVEDPDIEDEITLSKTKNKKDSRHKSGSKKGGQRLAPLSKELY